MLFTSPLPFDDALEELDAKGLMPTGLSSAEIRKEWSAELRRRSIFSARNGSARYLQATREAVGKLARGEANLATVRAELGDLLEEIGYRPEEHERGTLQDHSSFKRLNLLLETETRKVLNEGYRAKWEDPGTRRSFPAWELVRIYSRRVPRGYKMDNGALVPLGYDDWPSRWKRAGGAFYGGRMVAPVDAEVWGRLGSSELFDDGLDNPFPPFAFNSGFGLQAVDRRAAIALGVIGKDEVPGAPVGVVSLPPTPRTVKDEGVLKELKKSLDRDLKKWDSGELMDEELRRAAGGGQ